jgi:hypothetical protein
MDSDADSYYVMSRNLINASDRNRIEQRLNQVEGLDKEALRLLLTRQLNISHF